MWRTTRFYSADAPGGDAPPPAADEAPAEAAAVEAPAAESSAADVEAPTAEAEAPAAWNGEMEHLAKQPWWSQLDESARKDIEGGLRTKWSNLESGYSKKFQELAEQRKAPAEWEAERTKLNDELRDLRLLHDLLGTDDKDVAAKIEAERARLMGEHEAALTKLRAESDPIRQEVEQLRAFRAEVEKEREAAYQQQVDAYAAKFTKQYGDILANKAAADRFERLLQGVTSDEEMDAAADFVRTRFSIKAPKLPAAAEHASRGDGAQVQEAMPSNMTPDQMIEWAAAKAMARAR